MTKSTTIRPEEFESHAGSLRRLARHLLPCPAAAEDAVQETWVRASQTPRPREGKVGGWLRTVLHHIVVSEHRSQSRRSRREAATAERQPELRREEVDPTVDLLARREQLNQLTHAVEGLDPELQTVVFLRYFDGLPPRRIASRLGIPVSEVHKRLRRAHVRLRKLLDASSSEGKDWRAGMAALFGLPLPRASTPLWTQTIERMSTTMPTAKTTMILTAAAATVAVPLLLQFGGSARPTVPTARDVAHDRSPLDPATADGLAQAALARREIEPTDSGTIDPLTQLEPYVFELVVHATDRYDRPAPAEAVVLGPAAHPLNLAGYTDADGSLTVRWRGSRASMQVLLADAGVHGGRLAQLQIEAGTPYHVGLRQFHRPIGAKFKVGVATEDASSRDDTETQAHVFWVREHEIQPPVAMAPTAEDGIQRFVTPTPALTKEVQIEETEVSFEDFTAVSLVAENAPPASLRLRAIDEERGMAVAQAHVVIRDAKGRIALRKNTDTEGNLEAALITGAYTVRVGGGDHGVAERELHIEPGGSLPWTATLDRGAEVRGSLLDVGTGAPLAGWVIRAASRDANGAWADQTITDEHGHFAIPNAPRREHSLAVYAPTSPRDHAALPAKTFSAWPDSETTLAIPAEVARADALGQALVRFDATGDRGATRDLRARLIDLSTGYAGEIPFDAEETLNLHHLPVGHHLQLTLGGTGIAWREHTRFEVTPDTAVDLGTANIPAPARLLIENAEGLSWLAQRRDDVCSRIEVAEARSLARLETEVAVLDDITTGIELAAGKPAAQDLVPHEVVEFAAAAEPTVATGVGLGTVPSGHGTEEWTTGYLLPAGRYIAVFGSGQTLRVVDFELAAGQELDLATVLK